MAALPPISDFTNAVDNGHVKTFFGSMRTFLADLLGATGTVATALQTLKVIFSAISAKTSAYTVVDADRGRGIKATGTWTLSLTSAATLGEGFCFAVRNIGSGVITVDPAGAETIDGASTLSLSAGVSCIIVSDGSSWITFGKGAPEFSSNVSITAISPMLSMLDSDNAIGRFLHHDNGTIGFLDSLGQWAAYFFNNKDAKVVGNFYVGNSGAILQTDGNLYMPCRGQWLSAALDTKVGINAGAWAPGCLVEVKPNTAGYVSYAAGTTIAGSALKTDRGTVMSGTWILWEGCSRISQDGVTETLGWAQKIAA